MPDETFHRFDRQLTEQWRQTPDRRRLLVAHVTDTHVQSVTEPHTPFTADFPSPTWGQDRLAEVIREIQSLANSPDLLLLGGDMTQTGSAAEWAIVFDTIRPLQIPVLVTLGNHEHRNHVPDSTAFATSVEFLSTLGFANCPVDGYWAFSRIVDSYRFVVVDSMHCGDLGNKQHEFLRAQLGKGEPTVVLVHRPLVRTGHTVDELRLIDPTFEEMLESADNVIAVVCGHAHRHVTVRHGGRLHFVTSAVNFGNDQPTGYRLFCLSDGRVAWSVNRIIAGPSWHCYRGPVVQQQGAAKWECV